MTVRIRAWRVEDRHAALAPDAEPQEHGRTPRPSSRSAAEMPAAYVAALEGWLADEGERGKLLVPVEDDGPVVGFASCFVREGLTERDPLEVNIHDLVFAASSRRRGIGRALVNAACAFAAANGVRRVALSVLALGTLASSAHEAMGFRPVALRLEKSVPAFGSAAP